LCPDRGGRGSDAGLPRRLVTQIRLTLTVAKLLSEVVMSDVAAATLSLIKQVGPLSIVHKIGINLATIRPTPAELCFAVL
jgi:hypothetical protein